MMSFIHILAEVAPHAEAEAHGAAGGGGVGEIFKTFHVETPFFVSQVVSFLIVAFLLKKFAFGPIQAMLEQRKSRIAEGEANLVRIQQQLADSEKHTAEAIAKANSEAQRLVNEAKESAAAFSEQKSQEAIASAQQILVKAEAAARAEREQIAADLKREFGRLVTATTAQVTGKVLNADDQKRINDEALATVEA
ncbi:F0F1 ATP synthase subunit B [Luteolibacter ambystomatis]|nr:F0F1 ATP synthase subunit B [Luteolibacter ambystomatis]